jgi:transcriptional regulator with XRE-family HTH domain
MKCGIDALQFFEELKDKDLEYAAYVAMMGPLAEFMAEYEYQKGIQGITQTELAQKVETRQSAISRFEAMKHPPNYEFLVKIAGALGDTLFMSPAGSYCLDIPYDLRAAAKAVAERRGMTVAEFATNVLREILSRESFQVSDKGSIVVKLDHAPYTKPVARSWANSSSISINMGCQSCNDDTKGMAG